MGKSGYEGKIMIGMDIAASEFFKDGKYDLDFKNPETKESDWISSDQLLEMYQGFIRDYPVVSIENAFDQDDWEGYAKLTASTQIQIVGDDLLVTNPKRIGTAIEKKACNGLLLKVKAGARWCPTGPGRLRTASLLTWWWDSALDRSKLERPAGLRDSQSTASSSGLKKNSEPTRNTLEPTSDKEFRARVPKMNTTKT